MKKQTTESVATANRLPHVPAKWWEALLVGPVLFAVLSILASIVATIAVLASSGTLPDPNQPLPAELLQDVALASVFTVIGAQALVLVSLLGYVKWKHKLPPLPTLGFRAGRDNLGKTILVGLIGIAVIKLLFVLVTAQLDGPTHPFTAIVNDGIAWQLALVAIAGVVVAPLVEETLFRGYLFPAFAQRMGVMTGVVLTSVIFALFHAMTGGLAGFINALLLGLLFCWAYRKSGSLWLPIGLHAASNAAMFLVLL